VITQNNLISPLKAQVLVKKIIFQALLLIDLLNSSCSSTQTEQVTSNQSAATVYCAAETAAASKKANDFFERSYQTLLDRSMERKTLEGNKKDQDQWDDLSEAFAEESQ
jgi:hypothetical protein